MESESERKARDDSQNGNYNYNSKSDFYTNSQNEKSAREYWDRQSVYEPEKRFSSTLIFLIVTLGLTLAIGISYWGNYLIAHRGDEMVLSSQLDFYSYDNQFHDRKPIAYLKEGITKDSLEKILSGLVKNQTGSYVIKNLSVFPKKWIGFINKTETEYENITLDARFLSYKKGSPIGQIKTRQELSYY